jgi:biopolymer transport protein ExbD
MAGAIATDAGGRRNGKPVAEPNVVPFIDVMLVLLIVFMVTAPTPTVDLRVDAPTEGRPPPPGRSPTVVSILDNAGVVGFEVDGQPTTLAQLNDRVLERAIANNQALPVDDIYAEARIFVHPDQSLAYDKVIDAMTHLHGGGFAKIGIYAEQAQT